jgi:hypothetical protein
MQRSLPYQGRLFPAFSILQWTILIVCAWMIAILSLGAHDLAIAHLGIPFPDEAAVPAWAKLTGQFVRIAATVYFCHLASWYLDRRSALAAALLVGVIVVLLHETLRVITVDNVLVEGWIDGRWMYMTLQRLPAAGLNFFWGVSAVLIARRFSGKRLLLATAVLAATALGYFVVRPAISGGVDVVVHAFKLAESPELYQMPYNFYVYQFIYGTFIEPTIAMFLIAWLAWPGLRGLPARRIAILAAFTLLMRGRVIGTFLFCFWIEQPLGMAIAAEGQFFAETLVLAVLTALVWNSQASKVSTNAAISA